jgi:hypothetical protein
MFGIKFDYASLGSGDTYNKKEIYIGTPYLKFISFGNEVQEMKYGTTPSSRDSKHYSFLNFIVINEYDFKTTGKYKFTSRSDGSQKEWDATWSYNLETRSITSELFYDTVKEDAIKKNDYIYPVAIAKNFNSWFRVYGIALISIEQYDYTQGSIQVDDGNGSKKELFTNAETDASWSEQFKNNPVDGRFQGMGLGYKITAEFYKENFSFFITSFYKRIKMDNQYSKLEGGGYADQIIADGSIQLKQKYTSFGLRYRF